jgi:hypothetical protein
MVIPLASMGRAVGSERQGTGRLVDTGALQWRGLGFVIPADIFGNELARM